MTLMPSQQAAAISSQSSHDVKINASQVTMSPFHSPHNTCADHTPLCARCQEEQAASLTTHRVLWKDGGVSGGGWQAARYLRDARMAAGYSKRALAEALSERFGDKPQDTWRRDLSRYENRPMVPHQKNAEKIGELLPEYDPKFVASLHVSAMASLRTRVETLTEEVRELRSENQRLLAELRSERDCPEAHP